MELNRAVAENIKRIRKSKKLSLERTAALSGVSRSMLGQIERGEANPSVAILGKLAAVLKVPAELFLENREFVLDELDTLLSSLTAYRDAVADGDREHLKALLEEGKQRKEAVDG